jgi:HK97 family phage major capsid protein
MSTTIKVPKELHREALIERTEVDGKKGFKMSISSDVPYKRYDWWNEREYYEVLDHSPGGCNDARLKKGLPILFNHDRDQHLGRATAYANDGHKYEVTDLIWSESEFAQTKKKDAESGALPDTSVGYRLIDEGVQIGEKDGLPVYRFRWEIHEASLVTIPADITVGVGRSKPDEKGEFVEIEVRSAEKSLTNENQSVDIPLKNENKRANQMSTDANPAATETKVDVVKEREGAVAAFKARCKKIDDYVAGLKNQQWREAATIIANKHKDGEADFDTFRTDALNSFEGVKAVETNHTPDIGMTPKEVKRFSLLRACASMAKSGRLVDFEKETCEAAQKQMRRELSDSRSFIIPEEVSRFHDEIQLRNLLATRAQNVTTATAGGYMVQSQYGGLIELLRNKTALGRLGITIIDGLVGDFIMPVHTGGATAYWVSETGAITDSEATFGQKAMAPHRLGAAIPYTMQFLVQSSLSADAFLRNEMDTVLALKKDLAGLYGTGASGEPLGLANTVGINATVTYGGAPTWADVVEHETGIAVDNADIGSMGFLINSTTVGKWKTTLKDSVAGAGYLLSDNMTTNGYPVVRSNQVASSNQSFFGVWSQLLLGIWAGREVTIDSITLAKTGQHQIIMNEFCDFLVRQPLAFNVSTDGAAQ